MLSQAHRQFLQSVYRAAFNNPFSTDTQNTKLELALTRNPIDETRLNAKLLAQLQSILHDIEQFSANHQLQLEDQQLLQNAQLYRIYLGYYQRFDLFIEQQIKHGDEPIKLSFAGDILDDLQQIGLNQTAASKYLSLFFQTRRAYYFISQAILGQSACMQTLRKHLWNNLFTVDAHWYLSYFCEHMEEFSTLLLGDTGTGKSRIAQAIGSSNFIPFDVKQQRYTESFTRSFQAINLSQYPSSLLEAELFGHKKGAFTGAIENRSGLFERCSAHGAVFIDEVGEIDETIQVKLLTVLQDRVFSAVGSSSKLRFEGRVIAATNQNLEQLVNAGQFREDFYYRLSSDVITIPTLNQRLRENPDELRVLITSILTRTIGSSDQALIDTIEQRIHNSLPQSYQWPGNVRELEQCVRSICLTGTYTPLLKTKNQLLASGNIMHQTISAQQLLQQYCYTLYELHHSYEKVARITELDRRTVKKHIERQNQELDA